MDSVDNPGGILGTPQLKTRYDPGSPDELAYTIVDGVASVADVDVDEIQPQLYSAIDVDAMEETFADFGSPSTRGHLLFEFYGRTVVVYADGTIEIYDLAQ